jgi:hypothetical protein
VLVRSAPTTFHIYDVDDFTWIEKKYFDKPIQLPNYMGCLIEFYTSLTLFYRLGSVAGPVIQATGRSEFEDGLGSGDFVSGYSYHMSVRTRLSDHTKQTKFQSQRPNYVETPVPSISSTEVQQHRDSQYLDG